MQNPLAISGTVRATDVEGTLPSAHVFLSNTTFGKITDRQGKFQIKVDRPGTYELIVRFTGYKTFSRTLVIESDGIEGLEISLKPQNRDLGSFTIVAKNRSEWRKNLKLFKDVFLGTSSNAESTKILNEEVMNFYNDRENGKLIAFADEPLMIRNKALGYDIEYYLETFELFYTESYSRYLGYPLFKEISLSKPSSRVVKRRREAYLGSIEHFFLSIFEGKLLEEGFIVRTARDTIGGGLLVASDTVDISMTKVQSNITTKSMSFEDYLFITYTGAYETEEYERYKAMLMINDQVKRTGGRNRQRSWIKMVDQNKPILFESSGYVINPLDFYQYGFWGFEKMADRVPLNYRLNSEN
ncbi:carboxypeptidase-like regulatory domain-containing protein [Roseivirga misakiensis]|uniref:Carboxypeptidase-like regulatory domain-containing protein n=1 Tax=Roseivirga misakiensis TaxID=1563681 RepID=A0A1E5SKI5_9BACT|nr:carboxypeptidase-like regulatory domain-containing protein [Roseivirga misakiensis]OEJ99556.1 hypothetical protein BFP71_08230 [Roseivirga misakiensis]